MGPDSPKNYLFMKTDYFPACDQRLKIRKTGYKKSRRYSNIIGFVFGGPTHSGIAGPDPFYLILALILDFGIPSSDPVSKVGLNSYSGI